MKILVLNSGSSTIKYQLFDMGEPSLLASGVMEKIGESESRWTHRRHRSGGCIEETRDARKILNHKTGLECIFGVLSKSPLLGDACALSGIGHRVVHGGETFKEPVLVDDKVVNAIRDMIPLAPLHNPANLMGIEIARKLCPHVPQVAVFDTAFHQSIPPHAHRYAIPEEFYIAHRVRRYGFHGTSHQYVARRAAVCLGERLESLTLITLHLGNGASASAIKAGKSIDTSMGMTPLEGLIMGTRSGDLDPAIHVYLARQTGMTNDEVEALFNRESGLKGIFGENDMRKILRRADLGDERAQLAIEMYCYRVKKYIGAYLAILSGINALVFTGGIGENGTLIRQRICGGLEPLGMVVDDKKNQTTSKEAFEIQAEEATVKILVVPTHEELEIARQTVAAIQAERP
jgi:acetate kinase